MAAKNRHIQLDHLSLVTLREALAVFYRQINFPSKKICLRRIHSALWISPGSWRNFANRLRITRRSPVNKTPDRCSDSPLAKRVDHI
jgi:hypothetical protein